MVVGDSEVRCPNGSIFLSPANFSETSLVVPILILAYDMVYTVDLMVMAAGLARLANGVRLPLG
jgi:hypothetical protein